MINYVILKTVEKATMCVWGVCLGAYGHV